MHNKIRQQRFKQAVYIAIFSFALLLLLLGFISKEGYWRDLSLNIGTDLLGVVLLFFIVNKFFGLDTEDNVSERIEKLLDNLDRREDILCDNKEGIERFQFELLAQSLKELDVVGINLAEFLQEFYDQIICRVQDGAIVRILIIDPHSQARELINRNTTVNDFDGNVQRALGYAQKIQKGLINNSKRSKGSFEVHLINWVPSFSAIIVDKSLLTGTAKIAVYSLHYEIPVYSGRLNILAPRKEQSKWFDYCVDQFNRAWEIGIKWDGMLP
jgi:hypothetical protein